MTGYNSFNYRYTLLLLNYQEEVISGLTSNRDLPGTQRLAHSLLNLDSRIAFVDIYTFTAHATDLANCEPLKRVSLDDESEE